MYQRSGGNNSPRRRPRRTTSKRPSSSGTGAGTRPFVEARTLLLRAARTSGYSAGAQITRGLDPVARPRCLRVPRGLRRRGSALRSASEPLKVLKPSDDVAPARSKVINTWCKARRFSKWCNALRVPWTTGKVEFTVSRKHALYDAFNVLGGLSEEPVAPPFFVKFRGRTGLDGADLGLFRPTSDGTYDLVEDKDAATARDKNPRPGLLLWPAARQGPARGAPPVDVISPQPFTAEVRGDRPASAR